MTVIIVTGHSTPFEMDYYRYPFGSMYLTFFFLHRIIFQGMFERSYSLWVQWSHVFTEKKQQVRC